MAIFRLKQIEKPWIFDKLFFFQLYNLTMVSNDGEICYRNVIYTNTRVVHKKNVFNACFYRNHEEHVCFPTKVVFYDGLKQCFNGMVTPAK